MYLCYWNVVAWSSKYLHSRSVPDEDYLLFLLEDIQQRSNANDRYSSAETSRTEKTALINTLNIIADQFYIPDS